MDDFEKEWRRRGYAIIPRKPEDLDMDYEENQRMIAAGVQTITVRLDEMEMLLEQEVNKEVRSVEMSNAINNSKVH